jgi:hypothetical protein
MAFTSLKGNNRTAFIRLNTTSKVNPTILKGRSSNHTNGKRTSIISAIGQQITKRRHHSTKATKVLIVGFLASYYKPKAKL